MTVIKYVAAFILIIAFLIILGFSIYSKKPFSLLLINLLSGVVCLTVINLTNKYTGCYIPINQYSLISVSTLGLPAVAGLLILQIIFY